MRLVKGTVHSDVGLPIEGVLVMGEDLNYAETNSQGEFELRQPEVALFFWCTGFRPASVALQRGVDRIDIRLETLGKR
jgi:hypothetical protein